jgi:hypothetical protein
MANDRFLIRKRTLCATASNDGTWPKVRNRRTAALEYLGGYLVRRFTVE